MVLDYYREREKGRGWIKYCIESSSKSEMIVGNMGKAVPLLIETCWKKMIRKTESQEI